MLLKDFLQPYYSDYQAFSNISLLLYLQSLENTELKPFIWILKKRFNFRYGVHPDDLIDFCNSQLHVNTIEELGAWIDRFNSLIVMGLIDFIDSPLNLLPVGPISFGMLKQQILNTDLLFEDYCKWHVTDSVYRQINQQ